MGKNLTIQDLLAKKDQLKKKKRKKETLFVESLNGNIVIEEPTRSFCIEAIEMSQENAEKADIHVVYNCVVDPNLKDSELQKGFGCTDPRDIVEVLFNPGEIASIAGHCIALAGYGSGVKRVDEELKN